MSRNIRAKTTVDVSRSVTFIFINEYSTTKMINGLIMIIESPIEF